MTTHLGRRILAMTGVAIAAVATAGPATAATGLTPPPPSWYFCTSTGSGTVCHGTFAFEHYGESDGTCPQGFDLLENGYKEELGKRVYDRDGKLVERVLHDRYVRGDPRNVIYNSVTGKSVAYWGDITETDTFAVPGDFDSMSARLTGNLYTVTASGSGVLVHDVGVLAFDPDGNVTEDRGPKMLFDGQNDALCAALA